jgi:hypothetical protein
MKMGFEAVFSSPPWGGLTEKPKKSLTDFFFVSKVTYEDNEKPFVFPPSHFLKTQT